MLIIDSELAPKLARGTENEKKAAQLRKWVEEQTANAVYVKEHEVSPANSERQMGKPFWPVELEAKLKLLNPNLHFEVNPHNPQMKAVFHIRRGEGKFYICAYHNTVMPEHSIMRVKEELVQDLNFIRDGADGIPRIHLDRKDLSPAQLRDDPDAIPLGMKKILIPWGEFKRGWRTVTIKLVEAKLASPAQVENIFGADDRPEWARHMGKQDIQLPW